MFEYVATVPMPGTEGFQLWHWMKETNIGRMDSVIKTELIDVREEDIALTSIHIHELTGQLQFKDLFHAVSDGSFDPDQDKSIIKIFHISELLRRQAAGPKSRVKALTTSEEGFGNIGFVYHAGSVFLINPRWWHGFGYWNLCGGYNATIPGSPNNVLKPGVRIIAGRILK